MISRICFERLEKGICVCADTERENWVPDFKFQNQLLNVMRKTKI